MEHSDFISQYLKGIGTEIGAHVTPIPGINPIYVDKFEVYVGERGACDYLGEATDLPFFSNSLEYVASSHVLEHSANPIKAIVEWHRVLRPGGIIYTIVPDKRRTFDHPRKTTTIEHLFEDYFNNTTDLDSSHIDDFCYNTDWNIIEPSAPQKAHAEIRKKHADFYWEEVNNGRAINLHFHVFEPDQFERLLKEISADKKIPANLTLERIETEFPSSAGNGILAVLRKRGPESLYHKTQRTILKKLYPQYPLLPKAIRAPKENAPIIFQEKKSPDLKHPS